jgi:hypothetical protein
MLERPGWTTAFTITVLAFLCLFGVVTLSNMFALGVLQRGRQSTARRIFAIFGTIGLSLAAALLAVSLINNEIGETLSRSLWPTVFVLGAGEYGDPLWYVTLVFAAAILSNVGLYGLVGLIAGSIWARFRTKHGASLADQ